MIDYSISVIIPTCNRPRQVCVALNSIMNQSIRPDEVIVIDDASGVYYDIEEKYAGMPGLIYVKLKTSVGASRARNLGASQASGDILMFLDDDDYWEPCKIENQIKVFKKNPSAGLVYSGRIVCDEKGRKLYNIIPKFRGNLGKEILFGNHIGITSSVAIFKEAFDEAGGFDTQLPARQDYELWIRATQKTSVDFSENCDVYYVVNTENPGSQISGNPEKYERANSYIIKKHQALIDYLPFFLRRKAYAGFFLSNASKYSQINYLKTLNYALKSIYLYPSIKGLAYLLPFNLILLLRKRLPG